MPYNPERHHRQSTRLLGYDYASPGVYFITVCTHGRMGLFGEVVEEAMRLSACGCIALGRWRALPRHFSRVRLDAFVMMPNHVHGIVVIRDGSDGGRGRSDGAPSSARSGSRDPAGTTPGSLGAIGPNFKQ